MSHNTREHEIHLWIFKSQADPQQIFQMEALLSPSELERSNAFYFKRDSRRYVYAHGMLRLVLGKYTEQLPEDIEFSTGPHGKPYIDNYDGVQFNLSRTEGLMAIAVISGSDVGIDIEQSYSFADMADVSRKIMTIEEYRQFETLEASKQTSFFYKCWVRKEAAVKAWGIGIDDNLCKITALENGLSSTDEKISRYQGGKNEIWKVVDIDLGSEYAGAVCFRYQDQERCSGSSSVWRIQRNILCPSSRLFRDFDESIRS